MEKITAVISLAPDQTPPHHATEFGGMEDVVSHQLTDEESADPEQDDDDDDDKLAIELETVCCLLCFQKCRLLLSYIICLFG